MPVDLTAGFKRLLTEIITVSSGICDSALDYTDYRNFNVSERLRHELETIRISADAVLQALAKVSLTSYSLDDRIGDWLASNEPHACLEKLREMNDILRPRHPAPTLMPAEDELVAVTTFFDSHKGHFLFLLTPNSWHRERPGQVDATTTNVGITTRHRNAPLSDVDQATVLDRKEKLQHQKLDEISRWLNPMECVQKHRDTLRLYQEGTCKWFRNTGIYQKWRAPGSHFLWLHGKAGCGKSVLIASTIEHIKNRLEREEVVVFFYCDFQNKRSTSFAELVRSLLSQLLQHIRDHRVDPGDFLDKVLKQKSERTLSLDDLWKLSDLISRAASFFRYEPMIVIDALDECLDIEMLLPALVRLSQSDVRFLVTSRPDQTIAGHFSGLPSLSFDDVTEEVAADIALHVGRELDALSHIRPPVSETKKEIDIELTERAEGRFRWVQYQLDALKRCTTREGLEEALDSLPNDLETTYERILGAIDERKSDGELARRVLALLMVAIEPLQLIQVVDGLSMDFEKRMHDCAAQQWLETKLLHSLSSLVSYNEETDIISLSHFSVKEYLTSRSALPTYQIITHEAHAEAAEMCMGYISVFLKQGSSRYSLERFPMLFYVLSSGFNHLAHLDSESLITLETLKSLGLDVRHHPSHWDRLCELREEILEWPYTPWPLSKHDFVLYILIAYSHSGLLRTFLSRIHHPWPRIRTNPLIYAAELRKTEHVIALLAYGADVDARGLVINDSYRTSPLEVAIDLADDVLVVELLRRGCSMTPELLSTAVCMPWCSTRVLAALVQTDEFAEWALGIGEEELYRSVFSGARPTSRDGMKADTDYLVLSRRLRQLGLDLSAQSPFGRELIERALRAAHISMLEFLLPPDEPPPAEFLIAASTGDTSETVTMVRFLLQKGIDVHAVSPRSQETALHLAAMCPWEPRSLELTRLLIDAGCDPRALNFDNETPLVVAVTRGHCSVVEFLLSCDVPLPSNILHSALKRCHNFQMIDLLLSKGADVHSVARSTGNTVLHCAIIESGPDQEPECLSLLKRFLRAGCDPTIRNSSGEKTLGIAAKRNFTSVVDLLLPLDVPLDVLSSALQQGFTLEMVDHLIQRGAGVGFITSDGDTVLHLAVSWNYGEETSHRLVKRLIDAGGDTTARNSTGKTVLEIAIERNFTSVVELLLFSDVPLPPDTLLIAVQRGSTLETIEYLIYRGADMHSTTSDGDTVLHLALYRVEEECCEFVRCFVNAGCNPSASNSKGNTVLLAAIERDYASVVELLLSFNVPTPPDILHTALKRHCKLHIIQMLARKLGDDPRLLPSVSKSDWDALLRLACVVYSRQYCDQVIGILEAARKASRANLIEDDIQMPVAKRPRFE